MKIGTIEQKQKNKIRVKILAKTWKILTKHYEMIKINEIQWPFWISKVLIDDSLMPLS